MIFRDCPPIIPDFLSPLCQQRFKERLDDLRCFQQHNTYKNDSHCLIDIQKECKRRVDFRKFEDTKALRKTTPSTEYSLLYDPSKAKIPTNRNLGKFQFLNKTVVRNFKVFIVWIFFKLLFLEFRTLGWFTT